MIQLGQPQRLGRMAYLLMLAKQLVPGIVILAIALVLFFASGPIAGVAIGIAKATGGGAHAASISYWIGYGVMLAFMLAIVSLGMAVVASRLEYRNYTFTFEEFGMRLRRGIVSVSEVTIPYRQMQDINIERGILHQMTGTARVVIDSAGHEEAGEHGETDIILDPVELAMAEDIRLMLQRKIGVQVVEGEREADREAGIAAAPMDVPPAEAQPPQA